MARKEFAAVISGFLALVMAIAPGLSWSMPAEERSWPHLLNAPNGLTCTFQPATCKRPDWLAFLAALKLEELAAPPGGRAYRWLWVNEVQSRYGFVPSIGFVEIVVNKNGSGRLRSSWSDRTAQVEGADIAAFEAALGKTEFTNLPEQDRNAANWLDYPPEQLMEATVDGHYHFVHRVGGISEPGIRDSGVLLENLARRLLPPSHQAGA